MSIEKPTRQDYYKLLEDALREDDEYYALINYLVQNGLTEVEAEQKLESSDVEYLDNLKMKLAVAELNEDRLKALLSGLRIDLGCIFNTGVVEHIIERFECEAVYFLNELDLCKDEFDVFNLKSDLLVSLCKVGHAFNLDNAIKYIEELSTKKINPDSGFIQRLKDELYEMELKEDREKKTLAKELSESDEYIRKGLIRLLKYFNTPKDIEINNDHNNLTPIKQGSNPDYIISAALIQPIHQLCINENVFDANYSLTDFLNCCDKNFNSKVYPIFERNKRPMFIYILSRIDAVNEKITLNHFGIKGYKVQKAREIDKRKNIGTTNKLFYFTNKVDKLFK